MGVIRTGEEWRKIASEVEARREKGESVSAILKSMSISPTSYYPAMKNLKVSKPKRKHAQPTKINLPEVIAPIKPSGVFAFYGQPDEVARVVRSLQ